jgi:hypothetical protein
MVNISKELTFLSFIFQPGCGKAFGNVDDANLIKLIVIIHVNNQNSCIHHIHKPHYS